MNFFSVYLDLYRLHNLKDFSLHLRMIKISLDQLLLKKDDSFELNEKLFFSVSGFDDRFSMRNSKKIPFRILEQLLTIMADPAIDSGCFTPRFAFLFE